MENVRSDHLDTFGPSYKKSVTEAMGTTGVVRPEFRAALEKLRSGLGVSEDDAESLFLEAVAEKMKPMIKALVNEMERTQLTTEQLSQKRGIDMGEDLFKGGKGAQVMFVILYYMKSIMLLTLIRGLTGKQLLTYVCSSGKTWHWSCG